MSNLHCRCLVERAYQRALAQFYLECIVFVSVSVCKRGISCGALAPCAQDLALQHRLSGGRAPRDGGNATERQSDIADLVLFKIKRHDGGRERKFIGFPIANLEENRPP